MASYQVAGKNSSGEVLYSVSVSGVDQDGQVLDDLTVVNAVRTAMSTAPSVATVLVQKFQQVITVV